MAAIQSTRRLFRYVLTARLALLAAVLVTSIAPRANGSDDLVDFDREIAPLLKKHCVACHGIGSQNAGLRLDSAAEAAVGGISGRPIRGGTRATNELFLRVSSNDSTYRMPKNAPALTADEIDRFGRWVDQGCTWPDQPDKPAQAGPTRPRTWADWWFDLLELTWLAPAEEYLAYLRRFAVPLVVVHLVLLVVVRCRHLRRASRPVSLGRARWWFDLCARFQGHHYLLGLLALGCFVSWDIGGQRLAKAREELAQARDRARDVERQFGMHANPAEVIKRAYGDPPVPFRPPLPKRLGGEFYRGNCERNEELFNGGNYRTATLRVALCNGDRQPLAVGDAAPDEGLWVMFEVERSPHTADALFTEEYMHSVFLSKGVYDGEKFRPQADEAHPLETIEYGRRWVAYYPIGSPASGETATLSGLVYVYWGLIRGQGARGAVHYGISYELKFEQGTIAEDSDLWLGSLFWNPSLAMPQPGKVPLDEWFDYRPIPEIVGGNTSDPELLGVPEHERALEEHRKSKSQP